MTIDSEQIPEQVTAPLCTHGEGPVWDARSSRVLFVDMLAGDVIGYDPADGRTSRTHVGTHAAVLRPRRDGGWIIAREHDVVLTDAVFRIERRVEAFPVPSSLGSMNDGGCDPFGKFYCGTVTDPGHGALFRVSPDLDVTIALEGVTISNGLGASPDGRRIYYVDTPTGRIDVLAPGPDGLTDRTPWVRLEDGDGGALDGLAVDAEGGVWVAMWGAGEVRRYVDDDGVGILVETVRFPALHVTACAFGGTDLRDLYVTSSRTGSTDPEPLAGSLFRIRTDVPGVPVLPFAG